MIIGQKKEHGHSQTGHQNVFICIFSLPRFASLLFSLPFWKLDVRNMTIIGKPRRKLIIQVKKGYYALHKAVATYWKMRLNKKSVDCKFITCAKLADGLAKKKSSLSTCPLRIASARVVMHMGGNSSFMGKSHTSSSWLFSAWLCHLTSFYCYKSSFVVVWVQRYIYVFSNSVKNGA